VTNHSEPIAIVDIDGTIADVNHRLHFVRGRGRKDWKRFFNAMHEDRPIPKVIDWVRALAKDHEIVLVTGRPEEYRDVTERWLRENDVPYARLLMRGLGDRRQDVVTKSELVSTLDRNRIDLAIDDRPPVCEAYRAMGIRCHDVSSDEGNQDVNAIYQARPTAR
jgi:uncharacterized HAD superfamily protein